MDYYLENPERLNGQPKRTIADYVEQNGILTPGRFSSFEEAKDSGLEFIARSEHPQDYDGASDILKSYSFTFLTEEGILTEEDLFKLLYSNNPDCLYSSEKTIRDYCALMQVEENEFKNDVSFSYWEKLDGNMITVIADSAVSERYHVLWFSKSRDRGIHYVISENSKIHISEDGFVSDDSVDEIKGKVPNIINFYETIRNLDRFDTNHCPIVEIVDYEGSLHFLQSHRTRDIDPVNFCLLRGPESDEIEALFVRGATPPEGLVIKTCVINESLFPNDEVRLESHEGEGMVDIVFNKLYRELISREVDLILSNVRNLAHEQRKIVVGHNPRSILFKPKISVYCPLWSLYSSNEFLSLYRKMKESGELQYINLHVISDGRKAFIKRV